MGKYNHRYQSQVTPDPAPHTPTYNEDKQVGVVSDCEALNIRVEPKADAEIIAVANAGDLLVVTLSKSTDDYYKISTEMGLGGYVKKEYLQLKDSSVATSASNNSNSTDDDLDGDANGGI